MSNPTVNQSMIDLINKVTGSPDPAKQLDSVLATLADIYFEQRGGSSGPADDAAAMNQSDMQDLPYVPDEILDNIASHLDSPQHLASMRLVNKRFARATNTVFVRTMAKDRTIYPRYNNMARFLALLVRFPGMGLHMHDLTLVAQGLKACEYGYDWGWEDLQNWENVDFTNGDVTIMNQINAAHARDLSVSHTFLESGGYRTMLGLIFAHCPNLRTVNARLLLPGEHLPEWVNPRLFEQLSFYKTNLRFHNIFYGDWQYDTVHRRVTCYEDEYGEMIEEPGAGPQASFWDDLCAAIKNYGNGKTELKWLEQ